MEYAIYIVSVLFFLSGYLIGYGRMASRYNDLLGKYERLTDRDSKGRFKKSD